VFQVEKDTPNSDILHCLPAFKSKLRKNERLSNVVDVVVLVLLLVEREATTTRCPIELMRHDSAGRQMCMVLLVVSVMAGVVVAVGVVVMMMTVVAVDTGAEVVVRR